MSFSLVEEADPTTTKTKKNRNDCGMKVVIFLAQKKNKKDEKKWRYITSNGNRLNHGVIY